MAMPGIVKTTTMLTAAPVQGTMAVQGSVSVIGTPAVQAVQAGVVAGGHKTGAMPGSVAYQPHSTVAMKQTQPVIYSAPMSATMGAMGPAPAAAMPPGSNWRAPAPGTQWVGAQGLTPAQASIQAQIEAKVAAAAKASLDLKQMEEEIQRLRQKIETMPDVQRHPSTLPAYRTCALVGHGWRRIPVSVTKLRMYQAPSEEALRNSGTVEVVQGSQASWGLARLEAIMLNKEGVPEQLKVSLGRDVRGTSQVIQIHYARLPKPQARSVLGIRKSTVEPKFSQRQFLKRAYPEIAEREEKKKAKKGVEEKVKTEKEKLEELERELPLLVWAYREMSSDQGDPFVLQGKIGWSRKNHARFAQISPAFARTAKTVVYASEHQESLLLRVKDSYDPVLARFPKSLALALSLVKKRGLAHLTRLTGLRHLPQSQAQLDGAYKAAQAHRAKSANAPLRKAAIMDCIVAFVARRWCTALPDAVEWYKAMRSVGLCESLQPVRVHTYLNRLLGLPLVKQREVFTRFHDHFELETTLALETGAADQGMCQLSGEIEIIAQAPLCKDEETGAHTKLMTLKVTKDDNRMPWSQAVELKNKSLPKDKLKLTGLYRTISRTPTLRVITKEEGSPAYLIWWMQNRRRHLQRCNPHRTRELIKRCDNLDDEEAEEYWQAAYDDLAFDTDSTEEVHVVMGPVLSFWGKLRSILAVESDPRGNSRGRPGRNRMVMQFVNEVSKDGTRIIGVMVPPEKVFDLEEAFTGQSLRPGAYEPLPDIGGGIPLASLGEAIQQASLPDMADIAQPGMQAISSIAAPETDGVVPSVSHGLLPAATGMMDLDNSGYGGREFAQGQYRNLEAQHAQQHVEVNEYGEPANLVDDAAAQGFMDIDNDNVMLTAEGRHSAQSLIPTGSSGDYLEDLDIDVGDL